MRSITASAPSDRLARIEDARKAMLSDTRSLATREGPAGLEPWITHSWQRCLASGQRPGDHLAFEAISKEAVRRVLEASHPLVQAARPVLGQLAHAMAHTRYFAILTNADGIVVDVDGPVNRDDPRAGLITRLGVDLSERAVGTTAIGAALGERRAVWLHRGEHFFADTSMYSCAGAPVFGPAGQCVGMLDLTGIDVPERPELKHLVSQCAQRIENALLGQMQAALTVRLRWPGDFSGLLFAGERAFHPSETDGLISLDSDGFVIGSNSAAREMLPQLALAARQAHCGDLFAMPWENLFDAAMLGQQTLEVPLWSGLRLQALPGMAAGVDAQAGSPPPAARSGKSLRDVEIALIRKAVDQAKGNVADAARALGISRATVYRKLGTHGSHRP